MPRVPEPGTVWAGFRIEEEIGEGGFGRVFAAWDPTLQRRVALKVLVPEASGAGIDEGVRERFLRESRTAAGLDHPRIVPIHAASEHDGVPYLVMRFVDGGDLRSELGRGPLTLDRTVRVVQQIADALDRAHHSGLVHRDVKPANVLCAADSADVYLTDFGITRQVRQPPGAALTRTGELPASPHYASPEQLLGQDDRLGPATDVYSLGCTTFECLTGRVPFPGSNHLDVGHQHLHAERPRVSDQRPDLPAGLDDVLARAMAVEPADRYPSCGALAAALTAVRDGTAPVPAAPAGPSPAPTDPVPAVAPGSVGSGGSVFDQPSASRGADPTAPTALVAPTGLLDLPWDEAEVPPSPTRRSRVPWIVGSVLGLAVLAVAGLVVWAVNTDAGLEPRVVPTSAPDEARAPTLEELRALVPASLTSCVPPADGQEGEDQVRLVCPRDSAPELVTFTLFADGATRDAAFADAVTTLELDPAAPGECALADDAVHRYVGTGGTGQVACRTEGSRVDLVWTRGDQPLLGTAGGNGFYGPHYRFWADLVGRTDAAFPLPIEADLLDELPEEYLDGCERDIDLNARAPGVAAVACAPDDDAVDAVSWVRFGDGDTMDAWIEGRLASLGDPGVDTSEDACRPSGFGQVDDDEDDDERGPPGGPPGRERPPGEHDDEESAPAPTVGFASYELRGTTGQVLCFVNSSGQNVLFWTRDEARIGSIAVSDAEESEMKALLEWWEKDGHRP